MGEKSKDRRLWPFLSFAKRMPRQKFWEKLREAQSIFCYPGMNLLEAWFLAKTPILFSTESKVHNEISSHLEEKAGLIYLKKEGLEPKKFVKEYYNVQTIIGKLDEGKGMKPSGRGYTILLQKLQKLQNRTR